MLWSVIPFYLLSLIKFCFLHNTPFMQVVPTFFPTLFSKKKGNVSHTVARCAMSPNIAAVRRASGSPNADEGTDTDGRSRRPARVVLATQTSTARPPSLRQQGLDVRAGDRVRPRSGIVDLCACCSSAASACDGVMCIPAITREGWAARRLGRRGSSFVPVGARASAAGRTQE